VPVDISVIGNVEAYATITVKAQVGGELTKVHFEEGDFVKSGDMLFTIDARTYQAQLSQAEASLAKSTAQLAQAEANLARDVASEKYSRAQAERYNRLTKEGIISKEQNDQVQSNLDALVQGINADKAAIQSAKADIASMKAAIENAHVMLGYTTIRSPIDGRTGNLAVKQGNIVSSNTTDLMTINRVQPIYVTFSVPESQLRSIKRYMGEGKLKVMAASQDDPGPPEVGVLTFIDNAVDTSTGTIKLKGTFQNTNRKLWPGEFIRVILRLTTQPDAVVVPNQAVQTGQDGQYVFVVKQDQTVESRPVTVGSRVDQELVVESGLKAGETVVTEGQLRLAPGMRVIVRDRGGKPGGGQPGGASKRPAAES
jgi:multidrug efflux system membrane fusion protein